MHSSRLAFLYTAILVVLQAAPVFAPPANITITVPPGTSNHGNPKLLCTPLSWTDVAIFFLGNYVAHEATMLTIPGSTKRSILYRRFICLLFPAVGLQCGLSTISTFTSFGNAKLEIAKRTGVLCMLARTQSWRPIDGDVINHATVIHLDQRSGSNQGPGSYCPYLIHLSALPDQHDFSGPSANRW